MFKIRLKELRECKGITQRDFAIDFGVSKGTVGMWESGAREPKTLDEVNRIANYFGVSTDYLLGRKEKEKAHPDDRGGLSDKDMRLIAWFHSLPQEKRKAILMLGEAPEGLDE